MRNPASSGFTLIETLLSLALTALVVGILMITTKQFLMTWQTGLNRLDDVEELALAEMVIRRDIGALLLFSPDHDRSLYSFEGRATALRIFSEASRPEVGHPFIAIDFHTIDGKGLIRSSSPYEGSLPLAQIIVPKGEWLIPSRYSVRFSYRDERGIEQADWQGSDLPEMITLELFGSDQKSIAVWPIRLAPRIPTLCARAKSLKACHDFLRRGQQGALQ